MVEGRFLDEGYVVLEEDGETYWTANRGIFRTRERAQKLCDWHNSHGKKMKVVRVELVIPYDEK